MRAIEITEFGGPDVLKMVERPDPAPGAGEVLIKVAAAGVSLVDVRQRQGVYNRAETRVGGVQLPNVPGLQAVGTVMAVGAGASDALVGRRVVTAVEKGAYAELMVAPEAMCVEAAGAASDPALAILPMQGLTAYFLLTASTRVAPGETVLVHSAGSGVGNIAVQVAKILGAGMVIGTATSPERQAAARDSGCDLVVDYSVDGWTDQVLEATNDKGVDILLESVGGKVFEQNWRCLATFGRHLIFGSAQGPAEPIAPRSLMTRSQSLTGLYLPVFFAKPQMVREGLRFLVDHANSGDLSLPSIQEFALADAAEAHRMLEDRRAKGGIVLKP